MHYEFNLVKVTGPVTAKHPGNVAVVSTSLKLEIADLAQYAFCMLAAGR